MNRRAVITFGTGAIGLSLIPRTSHAQSPTAQPLAVEVWKSPSCGCCAEWVTHLESNGFQVVVNDVGNNAARSRLGVPARLSSCHTAKVGPYAIEGHVPAADIRRLLSERPDAMGLAVPGMPIGSPGMDGPEYGGRRDPYDVLLILRDGRTQVFNRYFSIKERT
jgi:hypothetical protein